MNNPIKKYYINKVQKLTNPLLGLLLLAGSIYLIIKGASYYTDFKFYFAVIICIIASPFIFFASTMRIEIYREQFILKYLKFNWNKIEFKDIVEITTLFLFARYYLIAYYKNGEITRRMFPPMQNMYDFLNEVRKRNPAVTFDKRIDRKIEKLKREGKIV